MGEGTPQSDRLARATYKSSLWIPGFQGSADGLRVRAVLESSVLLHAEETLREMTWMPSTRLRYGVSSCHEKPEADCITSTVNSSLMRMA